MVELDRGVCGLCADLLYGDAVGQCERPCEMEDAALQLLGGNPGCRGREHTDSDVD